MHTPFRILISSKTHERLGGAIREVMGATPFECVFPEGVQHADHGAHFAFISRDVTGLSTKHVIEAPLESFYQSLRASPDLRWVHVHSAGADRPIFAELRARHVEVSTSTGANSEIVAQTALAGLLALNRQFPKLFAAQQERRWTPLISGALPRDLAGQTVVLVGWGSIGQRLAAILTALGMKLIVVRSSAEPAGPSLETVQYSALNQVLPRADWLVLACPLTDKTRRLVNAQALAVMNPGSSVINVSRGEVIEEPALIQALQAGRISGAYLDVFEHEPLGADSALWGLKNVIVTPHCAGHSDGNEDRVDGIFLSLLARHVQALT